MHDAGGKFAATAPSPSNGLEGERPGPGPTARS